MNNTHYLACDLGAESGRIILGTLAKGQLSLEIIHQFTNKTQVVKGRLHWDLAALEKEIFAGLEKAAGLNLPISGLSADCVCGDYVLLDANDRPLQAPVYGFNGQGRDETAGFLKKLPLDVIYAETGIPLMPLHTLFKIEAEQQANPGLFQRAQRFLPLADYLNTRFSGIAACEESLASTTQLYNPQTHAWSPRVVAALDLPGSIMPRLVPGGTAFGPVIDELRVRSPFLNTRVIATCSQAAAGALAAVPARPEQHWAYLYSDSTAQFGVERSSPIMSGKAHEFGFTNEVGLGGSIRLVKNSAGLGLVEACRQAWQAAGKNYSEDELNQLAQESGPAEAHISIDDPRFSEPGDLLEKITAFCRETGQPVPATPGEVVRMILESLALAHAETLHQIESLTGQEIEVLHVVGKGANDQLLNQLVADTTGLPVITGPIDAAAIGNILIQALALWHIKSPDHLRSIVASSFPTRIHKPGNSFTPAVREKFRAFGQRLGLLEPAGV
jgi:rhamnulokinase